MTGVLGIQPYPVHIEVIAWGAYLVPMLLVMCWPAQKRPRTPTGWRSRSTAARSLPILRPHQRYEPLESVERKSHRTARRSNCTSGAHDTPDQASDEAATTPSGPSRLRRGVMAAMAVGVVPTLAVAGCGSGRHSASVSGASGNGPSASTGQSTSADQPTAVNIILTPQGCVPSRRR